MTKLFLLASCCVFILPVFCQSLTFRGGINFATRLDKNLTYVVDGRTLYKDYGYVKGVNFSAIVGFDINSRFSINTGLILNSRGYTDRFSVRYINSTDTSNHNLETYRQFQYIDLPLNLLVREKMGANFSFFGYGGPYIGIAVYGRGNSYKLIATESALNILESDHRFDLSKNHLPRLDAGLNVGFGVEIHQFFVDGSFSMGMMDIRADNSTFQAPNRLFTLGVGYRIDFGKIREKRKLKEEQES